MPRPPDHGPPDDGGDRAAERLRQFEQARGLPPDDAVEDPDGATDCERTDDGEDTGNGECTGTPAPDGPASEDEEDEDA